MTEAGFTSGPATTRSSPSCSATRLAAGRWPSGCSTGLYVIGFSFPVVPQGQARIRVQLSAAHSTDDVERAVEAFVAAFVDARAEQ